MFTNAIAAAMLFITAAFLPDTSTMLPFGAKIVACPNYTIHALAYDPDPTQNDLVVEYRVNNMVIATHDGRDAKVYIVATRQVLSIEAADAMFHSNLCEIPIPKSA